jgi:hypothetical protein
MARLAQTPRNIHERDLPEKDKQRLALQFLRDHPDENPITPARIWNLKYPNTLQKTWKRERKRIEKLRQGKMSSRGGHNKIL